jgi:hypothetical protein
LKRSLFIIFICALILVTSACGDGFKQTSNLSVEQLLEKAQQPFKQTNGFVSTVQGTLSYLGVEDVREEEEIPAWELPINAQDLPFKKEYSYVIRANNEAFSMYYKGNEKNFDLILGHKPIVSKEEGYRLQKYHYFLDVTGLWLGDKSGIPDIRLGLTTPSPYDSVHQIRSLFTMLKENKVDHKYVAKLKHENGMYSLEFTSNINPDSDPKISGEIYRTLNQWFKTEFKILLNSQGFVDQTYIDQHPNERNLKNVDYYWYFNYLKQSMWFDDQTFVLKKMTRQMKVNTIEVKLEMNLKGQLKKKVVLPQQVIDLLQ